MFTKFKLLFIFIFLCVNGFINAQTLQFDRYTTKDGLLSDEVYNMHQDRKGYIWLFTNYGAMKYNGKEFYPVLKNLPFNESFIYSFYENDKGQKWVANSNAKIYEIRNDSAYIIKGIEKVSEGLKKAVHEIYQLYVDDSLNIYALTKQYSYKFIKKGDIYRPYNLSIVSKTDSIKYSVFCKDNALLSVCQSHIYDRQTPYYILHKKLHVDFIGCDNSVKAYDLNCSVLAGPKHFRRIGNHIYLVFYNKIVKIDQRNVVTEIFLNSQITNYTVDRASHLWVSCVNSGLYEIDQNGSILNNYFNGKTVNDVIIDSQNGMWISTSGFGLYHCENLNNLSFNETEGLGLPVSFIKQIDDKLFVANKQGDLFFIEKKVIKQIKKSEDKLSNPFDIVQYKTGYLVSYSHKSEFITIDKGVTKIIYADNENFYCPYKYLLLDDGRIVGAERKSIVFVKDNKVQSEISLGCKVYNCHVRNGNVLVATENGVYEIENYKVIRPEYLMLTKNSIVTKIAKDDIGNYWFCTKGNGLFKLTNKNGLMNFSTITELPSDVVNDISFIPGKGILLSTNKGLYYNNGNSKEGYLKKWNKIYSEEVKSTVPFDDNVYLGTANGLVIISMAKLMQEESLSFNLSSVFVNAKRTQEKLLLDLNYKQNNLEFNFDVVLFSGVPPGIKYGLIGVKNYFGTTKNQQITFQNLNPGSYTLLVVPDTKININGLIKIPFNIIPAFWQTGWFMILMGIAGLGIIVFIILLIFRHRRRKENRKNDAEKLITEYKLIALKAQINPHFMSNCLTAIQHLILSNKVDEANQYLAKFSLLVRQVLNFSSKPLVTLREELDISELNIELEQLRFENKFIFEIENGLNLSYILLPPLILQPIVENAIWHGLLPLKNQRQGKLLIKVKGMSDFIHLIVEDNGVGRRNGNVGVSNLKESKGIDITRQRIYNLNHFYNSTSKADLVYEDLVDDLNNPIGTRVIIVLPLITFVQNE